MISEGECTKVSKKIIPPDGSKKNVIQEAHDV